LIRVVEGFLIFEYNCLDMLTKVSDVIFLSL